MASSVKVDLYKNAALPAARRVKDLLSRMSLEEKAAQMMCVWQEKAKTLVDEAGNFDPAKAKTSFKKGYGLGQVGRPSDAGKGKAHHGHLHTGCGDNTERLSIFATDIIALSRDVRFG